MCADLGIDMQQKLYLQFQKPNGSWGRICPMANGREVALKVKGYRK